MTNSHPGHATGNEQLILMQIKRHRKHEATHASYSVRHPGYPYILAILMQTGGGKKNSKEYNMKTTFLRLVPIFLCTIMALGCAEKKAEIANDSIEKEQNIKSDNAITPKPQTNNTTAQVTEMKDEKGQWRISYNDGNLKICLVPSEKADCPFDTTFPASGEISNHAMNKKAIDKIQGFVFYSLMLQYPYNRDTYLIGIGDNGNKAILFKTDERSDDGSRIYETLVTDINSDEKYDLMFIGKCDYPDCDGGIDTVTFLQSGNMFVKGTK